MVVITVYMYFTGGAFDLLARYSTNVENMVCVAILMCAVHHPRPPSGQAPDQLRLS